MVAQQVRNDLDAVFYRVFVQVQRLRRLGHAAVPVQQVGTQGVYRYPVQFVCSHRGQTGHTLGHCLLPLADQPVTILGKDQFPQPEPLTQRIDFADVGQVILVAQVSAAHLCGVVQAVAAGQGCAAVPGTDLLQQSRHLPLRLSGGGGGAEEKQDFILIQVGKHDVGTALRIGAQGVQFLGHPLDGLAVRARQDPHLPDGSDVDVKQVGQAAHFDGLVL